MSTPDRRPLIVVCAPDHAAELAAPLGRYEAEYDVRLTASSAETMALLRGLDPHDQVALLVAEPDLPDVVYLEQLTSAVYLDKRADVENYLTIMEQVSVQAAPPAESAAIIRRFIEDM